MQNYQAIAATTGDTVGLLLNFEQNSLTTFLNNTRIGCVALETSLVGPLHWMVTLQEEGDAVRISNLTGQQLDDLLDAEQRAVEQQQPLAITTLWDFRKVCFRFGGIAQHFSRLWMTISYRLHR